MVKPALAAARAVQVLDYLALHPGQSFTLKEVSRSCGINAASLLAVMAALADGGYVVRHPSHKTYAIGPGVIGLGSAALVQHPTVDAARAELGPLADELEGQCAAAVVMGRELVAVAVAGRNRRPGSWTQVGARFPFVAPYGAPFAAHGPTELREAWTQRGRRPQGDALVERLERTLDDVRRRGFAAVEEQPARREVEHLLRVLADEPGDVRTRARLDTVVDALADALVELDSLGDASVEIASVTVPVFSPLGAVVMVLTAGGFGGSMSGPDIERVGTRLRAAAEAVAAEAFGSVGSAAWAGPAAEVQPTGSGRRAVSR